MKPMNTFWTLVRYNLRLLPWYIWLALIVITFLQVSLTRITNTWTMAGGNTTRLDGPSVLVWVILGSIFFRATRSFEGGQIPDGEFLLTRPILRPTAYLSRVVLFFTIMLTPSLAQIYASTAKPDLRLEFYSWRGQDKTDEQIKFYRDQFPNGSFIHKPNLAYQKTAYVTTYVIPSGAVQVAVWNAVVAVSVALSFQMMMFSASPVNYRTISFFGYLIFIYFAAQVAVAMIFPHFDTHTTLFERTFFFFTHHGMRVVLLTLAGVVLIQWIALKRIQYWDLT